MKVNILHWFHHTHAQIQTFQTRLYLKKWRCKLWRWISAHNIPLAVNFMWTKNFIIYYRSISEKLIYKTIYSKKYIYRYNNKIINQADGVTMIDFLGCNMRLLQEVVNPRKPNFYKISWLLLPRRNLRKKLTTKN